LQDSKLAAGNADFTTAHDENQLKAKESRQENHSLAWIPLLNVCVNLRRRICEPSDWKPLTAE
jgi:hypothetical protein